MALQQVTDIWSHMYQEKREALQQEYGGTVPSQDSSGFSDALNTLCVQYRSTGLPRLVVKVHGTLDHVRSLTSAISSCTQTDSTATLVWGGLQILIEMACRFSEYLEATIDTIASFHAKLPKLDIYLALFPQRLELQSALLGMYLAYADFCIMSIKYLKRKPITSLLRFGFSSSQQRILRKSQQKIVSNREEFDERVRTLIDMLTTRHVKLEAVKIGSLPVPTMDLVPLTPSTNSSSSQINWPVRPTGLPRNVSFHGREDYMDRIHAFFSKSHHDSQVAAEARSTLNPASGPSVCVLQGLGGMGKTAIASQYAHAHVDDYDAVFWLPAEPKSQLKIEFCHKVANRLHLVEGDADLDFAVEEGKNWLEGTDKRWLIIFDNVNDVNDIAPYCPHNLKNPGAILATSQSSEPLGVGDGEYREIFVDGFSSDAGAAALFKYLLREPRDPEEFSVARKISEAVGGLPLAIAAVAGYVARFPLDKFLSSFQESSKFWAAEKRPVLGQYDQTLNTVFNIALGDLEIDSRKLLDILAFLNPDKIPEGILRVSKTTMKPGLDFLNDEDDAGYMHMIYQLQRRHLAILSYEGKDSWLSVHRSLQWTLLHQLNRDQECRQTIFHNAFNLVRNQVPEPDPLVIPEPEKWPVYQRLLPQVLSLLRKSLEPKPSIGRTLEFAMLLSDVAPYMWYEGHMNDCDDAARLAEEILDEINYDDNTKLRWDLHIIRGILCTLTGVSKRAEGFVHRQKSLDICNRMESGVDEPTEYTLTMRCISLADLAVAHLENNDFQKVEELMQECKIIYRKLGDEETLSFHWGRFYYHRAWVVAARGQPMEAIKLCRHALKLQEAHSGPNSTQTYNYRFALSEMLYHAGDIRQALKINEDVLHARCRLHGYFNDRTLTSFLITGVLQWRHGDSRNLKLAEENMAIAVKEEYQSHWTREQQARAHFYLSKFLQSQGRIEEARTHANFANTTLQDLLRTCPLYLHVDPADERVAFDLMVPVEDFRLTGPVHGSSEPWW